MIYLGLEADVPAALIAAFALGLVGGLALAMMRIYGHPILKFLVVAYVDVFRALEGQLKPSISMIVATDIDTDLGKPVDGSMAAPGIAAMINGTVDIANAATSSRARQRRRPRTV